MSIGPLADWTGLAAGLVVLAVLGGCSTTTSDQDLRRAALVESRSTIEPSVVRSSSRVTSITIRTVNGKFQYAC